MEEEEEEEETFRTHFDFSIFPFPYDAVRSQLPGGGRERGREGGRERVKSRQRKGERRVFLLSEREREEHHSFCLGE